MYIHVCVSLIHLHLKLIQHCKSTILHYFFLICWVIWEKGIKVIDGMRFADQVTLRQEDKEFPGGATG